MLDNSELSIDFVQGHLNMFQTLHPNGFLHLLDQQNNYKTNQNKNLVHKINQ